MRHRFLGRLILLSLGAAAGAITLAWTKGQAPLPQPLPAKLQAVDSKPPVGGPVSKDINQVKGAADPVATNTAAPSAKAANGVAFDRFRRFETLPDFTKQMVMSAVSGIEWLQRYNQPNGMFLHGYIPALNLPMEGDHFLHQAMAAFTLARAARFLGDDRANVRANQAILALLSTTVVDAATPGVRRPAQASIVCNRLASAGMIVMAIHELPDPAADLVVKAGELCEFIRQQQRDDGSLSYVDSPSENALSVNPGGINSFPGPALYGIALSLRAQPAAWKAEVLRKAAAYYRKWFKDHPDLDMVPWMTAACVEAYLATKDKSFAEFALEMNDWLCAMQYVESPDPRRPLWRGGFKSLAKDKSETHAPGIEAALYAQSLADACRLLRNLPSPDLARYDRYRSGLAHALQFLTTLQFTEANTQHIAGNYRHLLVGGFHPTHADGNLRVDQGASAVSAFIQFLASGADLAQ